MKQKIRSWLLTSLLFSTVLTAANGQEVARLTSEPGLSQNSTEIDSLKPSGRKLLDVLNFKAGLLTSSFYRSDLSESNGILTDPLMGWYAGVSSNFFKRRYHYSKAELSYVTKGAREFFATDGLDIEAVTRLSYVQASFLPVILKSEFKKINPSVGIGLYYAQKVSSSSKTGVNGGKLSEDLVSKSFFNVNQDFGVVLNLELMYKKRPGIEIRYEAGFKSQSTVRDIKNRALVFSIVI